MSSVKRLFAILAMAALLVLALASLASAQTAYPPDVGAGGANRGATQAASAQQSTALAYTGNDHTAAYAIAGGAAVLLGGGLIVVSRKRRVNA